jgi:hypothetical protein
MPTKFQRNTKRIRVEASMPAVNSDLPLRVYELDFLETDAFLGETGPGQIVSVPEGTTWLVRHPDHRIQDDYVAVLATEISARRFPGLSLASCRSITDAGLVHLGGLKHLRILDLFNTPTTDTGLQHILSLKELRTLNLAGTEISDNGLQSLKSFPALEQLHLGWCDIGDDALASLEGLPCLKVLDLRATKITDAGLLHVSRIPTLEVLGLGETAISGSGLKFLADLKSLRFLNLEYSDLSESCVTEFSERGLGCLTKLQLRGTRISRSSDQRIRDSYERIELVR